MPGHSGGDDEQGEKPGQEPEKVDNRKVVVEDLIYIDGDHAYSGVCATQQGRTRPATQEVETQGLPARGLGLGKSAKPRVIVHWSRG